MNCTGTHMANESEDKDKKLFIVKTKTMLE